MWSVHFDAEKKQHFLICNQAPSVFLAVPDGHEADAMALAIALDRAKAKPVRHKLPVGLVRALVTEAENQRSL